MAHDLYSDQYKFEWEHRAYLQSAINIAIVIATIVGCGLVSVARVYKFSSSTESLIVSILLAGSLLSLGVAAYSIFRAMHGFEYARIPTPSKLEGWRQELTDWHAKYGSLIDIEKDIDQGYLTRLCEAVENNWLNNKRRSAHIFRATRFTGLAALFIVVPAILSVYQDVVSEPVTHNVRILSGELGSTGEQIVPENEPEPETPEPQAPPPKPEPPPNDFFKEDRVPPAPKADEKP